MAQKKTTRRQSSSKKTASSSKTKSRNRRGRQAERNSNRIAAILLFAIGILLTAIAFLKGSNVWLALHNFLFGLFGIPAIFLGILVMILAILCAREHAAGSVKHKVWQTAVLLLLVCGEIQILVSAPATTSLWNQIVALYENGTHFRGGGLIGGILGLPLTAAFGKTGAAILVGVLIFIFALIITGATLLGFLRGVVKPVKKIEEGVSQHIEQQRIQREKRFDIDVDLGPETMPVHAACSKKKFYVPETIETETETLSEQVEEETKEPVSVPEEKQPYLEDLVKKAVPEPAADRIEKTVSEPVSAISPAAEVSPADYRFPPVSLLKANNNLSNSDVSGELRANADRLVDTLKSFGVETRIIDICRGPSVTRYELQPSAGVKISKITNLADDIALNLAAGGVRIEAPIPNKAAVGIEVPNKKKEMVTLKEIIDSPEFKSAKSRLTFAVGRDIAGKATVADIAKMPHMLIAGSTGSGKSVCINSMIVSLIYKSSPNDVRLLMIDPKVVELGIYNGIPHLLVPVVTDPRKAAGALGWAVTEMLNRYKMFAESGVRDLEGYNRMADQTEGVVRMPQIVIIIDELADLMMAASNEVEDSICRLAQMARAAGMHLVIATQRPSVDVITGVIKANIPSRIAFTVSSQVDSRTILDGSGAEKLLGKGDMLFNPIGAQKPLRVQGCFVTDQEVEQVVEFVKAQESADYKEDILEEIERQAAAEKGKPSGDGGGFDDQDPMLPQAIECVVEAGQASTSFLQRRLKLGYARAARIMDDMESRGIVGPQEGSKPREILISKQQWIEMNLNQGE